MVAFITSIIVMAAMTAGVVLYGQRRPLDARLTWGEANLAAVYAFAMFMIGYGIVPNQWILWADTDLGWTEEKLMDNAVSDLLPFTINYLHVRDAVVVLIYGIMIGLNIWLFMHWQNRGKAKPEIEPTSDYGRPLVREA